MPHELHDAAKGDKEMLIKLLKAGVNVNETNQPYGDTPLHNAAGNGRLELSRLLLDSGADPTIQNSYGETAAEYANQADHAEVLKLIQEAEVQIDTIKKMPLEKKRQMLVLFSQQQEAMSAAAGANISGNKHSLVDPGASPPGKRAIKGNDVRVALEAAIAAAVAAGADAKVVAAGKGALAKLKAVGATASELEAATRGSDVTALETAITAAVAAID